MLVSPYFVFRVELDPDPTDLTPHPLTDHELASRLSYFLWSSMPDDELLLAADQGLLQDPEAGRAAGPAHARGPAAPSLIDNFAGQWWLIRNVELAFKDVLLYPQWNDGMKASMRTELRMFAETFFAGERSMLEMLTAKQTFVDQRLAQHYGIAGEFTDEFVEVDFGELPFQGILNKAGLMTVLSHADHTSPVKRGKWVLENLLCQTRRRRRPASTPSSTGRRQDPARDPRGHRGPQVRRLPRADGPARLRPRALRPARRLARRRERPADRPQRHPPRRHAVRRRPARCNPDQRRARLQQVRRPQDLHLRARPRPPRWPTSTTSTRSSLASRPASTASPTSWSASSPATCSASAAATRRCELRAHEHQENHRPMTRSHPPPSHEQPLAPRPCSAAPAP
jgi:hypothetical protein